MLQFIAQSRILSKQKTKIKLNVVSYDEVEMFKARDGNIIFVLNDEIVVYNTNNKVLSKGRKEIIERSE